MGQARLTVGFACVACGVCASLACNHYCGRCPLDLLLVIILVSMDDRYCAKYYGKFFFGGSRAVIMGHFPLFRLPEKFL